jgi:hypothetical protein
MTKDYMMTSKVQEYAANWPNVHENDSRIFQCTQWTVGNYIISTSRVFDPGETAVIRKDTGEFIKFFNGTSLADITKAYRWAQRQSRKDENGDN